MTPATDQTWATGAPKPGELLGDNYRVGAQLGSGSQAQVFEARDLALARTVAVKVALRGNALLRLEGQALAAIAHPVVPAVYAIGSTERHEYLVMERLYGKTLEAHLGQRATASQLFDVKEAIELIATLAEGLAVVHRTGLAHRDVKPSNIILAPGARTVLLDFGVTLPEVSVGAQAGIYGTPVYMAPEAIAGQLEQGAAWRVDVYALGIVAFELLTGRPPFWSDRIAELLDLHLHKVPERVDARRAGTSTALADLVAAMLDKSPSNRPDTEDVAWRLRHLAAARATVREPLKVLVADDDPALRLAASAWVREELPDAAIERVGSGAACLAAFAARPPDLLLLDLGLGDMSGVEVFLTLSGIPAAENCQVAVISGRASDSDRALLTRLGVEVFIGKNAEASSRVRALARARAMALGRSASPR